MDWNREITFNCEGRRYNRAKNIAARAENIIGRHISYDGELATLNAFVAASSGWRDHYRTVVTFDECQEEIVNFSCNCVDFVENDGMCKHCAALCFAFDSDPTSFEGYRASKTPATSARLRDFMQSVSANSAIDEITITRDRMPQDAGHAIDLEPILLLDNSDWYLHFKICGPEGSYVVKNISQLLNRVKTASSFSYGKNLTFTHSREMFSETAQTFLDFLARAESIREQTSAAAYWRYRNASIIDRVLQLSEYELIDLLDLLRGRRFVVEFSDKRKNSFTSEIIDKNPPLSLKLTPQESGAYTIERKSQFSLIAQGERAYFWDGKVFWHATEELAVRANYLKALYCEGADTLLVAQTDLPLFCSTMLPFIEKYTQADIPSELFSMRPQPCKVEFYFDKDKNYVTCNAWAVYGQARYHICGTDGTDTHIEPEMGPLRNMAKETRAIKLVESYFADNYLGIEHNDTHTIVKHKEEEQFRTNGSIAVISLKDSDSVGDLLFGGLAEFGMLGEVYTTPAFDRLIRDKKPRVSFGVTLAGNLIDLEVSTQDLPAHELSALLSSYRQHKHFHKLKDGSYLSLEELDLSQLDRIAADLGITSRQLTEGHVELPSYRAFYLDEEKDLNRDRSFMRYLENFRATCESDYTVPTGLEKILRPYQVEGFQWLSARADAGFGGILADEMGLGKSIQLISFLLSRKKEMHGKNPSLIVCPASLVYNWLAEFERFAPEMNVYTVAGSKEERSRLRTMACSVDTDIDVLITSYDLLRIDASEWEECSFYCCALDEAQYIKNPATLTTKAVKRLNTHTRFALTGTPMENRLSELWSIFDFLMPGLLGSYARFRERFELAIMGGDEEVAHRLQKAVAPFMLRRCKADVLTDLPEKLESVVYVPLTGEQLSLYRATEQQLRESLTAQHKTRKERDAGKFKVEVLAELTKLRQLACDPSLLYDNYSGPASKLDAMCELIASAQDAGEKVLVFSQFTSFLARIATRLVEANTDYYLITGQTAKKRRLELVNAFNKDDTPVFLISLKAGGTGLNLTGASVVIHADPWWNASAQNQATDRAHRIGQTRVVSVQKVIAKGTIEERILHLQETKSELAAQVIGGESISLASLTSEELLGLLQDEAS